MDKPGDDSGVSKEFKTINLINVQMKDMSGSSEKGHALIIDFGADRVHVNSETKFQIEQWYEALLCSAQTAREFKISVTGAVKNIA